MNDTPEAKRAKLRQMVTVGSTLIRQRDSFVGKLTKGKLGLRHQLGTSAKRYRDESIDMLTEHPEQREIGRNRNFARLRDAFPASWPLRTKRP
jgi:hypothetical protein